MNINKTKGFDDAETLVSAEAKEKAIRYMHTVSLNRLNQEIQKNKNFDFIGELNKDWGKAIDIALKEQAKEYKNRLTNFKKCFKVNQETIEELEEKLEKYELVKDLKK